MKKLYNNKGPKRVHPSPPPSSSSSTLLSFLPTALLALASSLSPQEQEVLAYLLGSEKPKEKQRSSSKRQKIHPPELGCSCFGCYKSFWARWDSSPNRHVIHLIIDAFEEKLESKETLGKVKGKSRRKGGLKKKDEPLVEEMEVVEKKDDGHGHDDGDDDGYVDDDGGDAYVDDELGIWDNDEGMEEEEEEEEEKSSMRRFMSWVFGMNN